MLPIVNLEAKTAPLASSEDRGGQLFLHLSSLGRRRHLCHFLATSPEVSLVPVPLAPATPLRPTAAATEHLGTPSILLNQPPEGLSDFIRALISDAGIFEPSSFSASE